MPSPCELKLDAPLTAISASTQTPESGYVNSMATEAQTGNSMSVLKDEDTLQSSDTFTSLPQLHDINTDILREDLHMEALNLKNLADTNEVTIESAPGNNQELRKEINQCKRSSVSEAAEMGSSSALEEAASVYRCASILQGEILEDRIAATTILKRLDGMIRDIDVISHKSIFLSSTGHGNGPLVGGAIFPYAYGAAFTGADGPSRGAFGGGSRGGGRGGFAAQVVPSAFTFPNSTGIEAYNWSQVPVFHGPTQADLEAQFSMAMANSVVPVYRGRGGSAIGRGGRGGARGGGGRGGALM